MTADPWEAALEYRGMVVNLAGRMAGRGIDRDDLIQEGLIAVADAARAFDPTHGHRFGSYARPAVLNRMCDALRRGPATAGLTREPEAPAPDRGPGDDELALLRAAMDRLTGRERLIVRRRHGLDGPGETTDSIAAGLGLCRKTIERDHSKAMRKLAAYLGADSDGR